jgi:N-methylhydantoinase B/oxoprolinase/acetone carboxylase alpha subunit
MTGSYLYPIAIPTNKQTSVMHNPLEAIAASAKMNIRRSTTSPNLRRK